MGADRTGSHRCRGRADKRLGSQLPASHRCGCAGLRERLRPCRGVPGLVRALFRAAERIAAREALPPTEHHAHPSGIQSAEDRIESVPRRAGPVARIASGQPGHHRQHSPVGRAAVDGDVRAAPGDPDLLQVRRRGYRSLLARRQLSAGDALGARAQDLAAFAERSDVGQPPRDLHARQRSDHEPGHPQECGRHARILSSKHSADRDGRPSDPRASHLLRRADGQLCHRQGQHAGVRLSEGQGQRLCLV